MRRWLQRGSGGPTWWAVVRASRAHASLFALLLVPAIALASLGIQSIRNEAAARTRLVEEAYRSLSEIVRAQLEARIHEADRAVAADLNFAHDRAGIFQQLIRLQTSKPWLQPIVLLGADGSSIYPPESGQTVSPDLPSGTTPSRFDQRLMAAEETELALDRPSAAVALYAEAFMAATTSEERTRALNGQARCELKSGRAIQALDAYRRLIDAASIDDAAQARRALVARHQIMEIAGRLGDTAGHATASLDLLRFLVDHRLIVDPDGYEFYRRQVDGAGASLNDAQQRERRALQEREKRQIAVGSAPALARVAGRLVRAADESEDRTGVRYVTAADGTVIAFVAVHLDTAASGRRFVAAHSWNGGNIAALAREIDTGQAAWPESSFAVIDPVGRIVFSTNPSMASASTAGVPLTILPQWRVAAFPVSGSLQTLAARDVRRYVILIVLIFGMVAAAMSVAVRGVTRELALSRLRADFVASVSHELKTPLALIRMFGENLRAGWVAEDKRGEYYDLLVHESDRLASLIDNVLDFSSMEAGTRRYEMVHTDIAQLLREILDRYRDHLAAHRIELVEDLPAAPVPAFVDRHAIEQVVINLLSNAVNYMRDDERRIAVTLTIADNEIRISIADTGVGLTDGERARVFDRFYRAEGARARRAGGSGIGLTVVKHIVDAHRGELHVESVPGRGSTFSFDLPAAGREV